jgi:hypothetical protein
MKNKYGVILTVIGLIIFFSCMEGWGADWKFVIKSVLSETFIDVKSISKLPNNTVRVWKKGILTNKGREVVCAEENKQLKCKDLSYILALVEYDCTEKKWRLLSATWYSNDGTPLDGEDIENSWKYIVPDSSGDYSLKEVCE